MTSPSSPAIKEPRKLEFPAEEEELVHLFETVLDGDTRFDEFAQMLTDRGVRAFARDIIRAIVEAKRTNDLRPVQETIDSWYRTSLLARDPGFLKAMAGDEEDEEQISREERRRLLGLA